MLKKKSVVIVVDDERPCGSADSLQAAASAYVESRVITLSELFSETGTWFDRDSSLFRHDDYLLDQFRAGRRTLINRVVDVSDETAMKISGGDGLVTPASVFAKYCELLSIVTDVWGVPGLNASVGHKFPLNLQWLYVDQNIPSLRTPRFQYVFGAVDVSIDGFEDPLWKSPFDLYNWRASTRLELQIHPFVVDKPKGTPVVAHFVGSCSDVFSLKMDDPIEPFVFERIRALTPSIAQTFGAFIGEALLFIDATDIVFGAFSHAPWAASLHESFRPVLEAGVRQRLEAAS